MDPDRPCVIDTAASDCEAWSRAGSRAHSPVISSRGDNASARGVIGNPQGGNGYQSQQEQQQVGSGGLGGVGDYISELLGVKQHKYVYVDITSPKVSVGPTSANTTSSNSNTTSNASSSTESKASSVPNAWQRGVPQTESRVADFLMSLPHYAQLSSASSFSESSTSFEQDVLAATDALLASNATTSSSGSSNRQSSRGTGDIANGDSSNGHAADDAVGISSRSRNSTYPHSSDHGNDVNSGTDTDGSYHSGSTSSRYPNSTGRISPGAVDDRNNAASTSQPSVGSCSGGSRPCSSLDSRSHPQGSSCNCGKAASAASAAAVGDAAGHVHDASSTSSSSDGGRSGMANSGSSSGTSSSSSRDKSLQGVSNSSTVGSHPLPSYPDYMAGAPLAAAHDFRSNTSGTDSEIDSSYSFNSTMWGSPDNKALSSSSGTNHSSHGHSSSSAAFEGAAVQHPPLDETLSTGSYDDAVMEYIGSHVTAAAAAGGGDGGSLVQGGEVPGSTSSSAGGSPEKQQQQRGWKSWMVDGGMVDGAMVGVRGGIMARAASAISGLAVPTGGVGATGSSSMEQPHVDTAILIPQEYLQVRFCAGILIRNSRYLVVLVLLGRDFPQF